MGFASAIVRTLSRRLVWPTLGYFTFWSEWCCVIPTWSKSGILGCKGTSCSCSANPTHFKTWYL